MKKKPPKRLKELLHALYGVVARKNPTQEETEERRIPVPGTPYFVFVEVEHGSEILRVGTWNSAASPVEQEQPERAQYRQCTV